MKKTLLILMVLFSLALLLTGCEQVTNKADEIRNQAQKTYDNLNATVGEVQTQLETTKKQVIDTGTAINNKVNQAKEAADAVGKLGQ